MQEPALKILGHRGDGVSNTTPELRQARKQQGKKPENTLISFKKALDDGADGLEFDVFLSGDGVPVIIHDNELNKHVEGADPTNDDLGLVTETPYSTLSNLDVGEGEYIPTLPQTLDLMLHYPNSIINVELKDPQAGPAVVNIIHDYVNKGIELTRYIISSFDHDCLNEVIKLDKNLRIGLLFDESNSNDQSTWRSEMPIYSLHPPADDITPALLEAAKEEGIWVVAWTRDEPIDANDDKWMYNSVWLDQLITYAKQGYRIHLITDHPKIC